MAALIPWQNAPDFQFEIALDRFVYLMRLRWNDKAASWAMDLLTRAKTPLILGTRLCESVDLLHGFVGEYAPPGHLFVLGSTPTFESFVLGGNQLVYLTREEILAL